MYFIRVKVGKMYYRYTAHMTPSEALANLDRQENLPSNVFNGSPHSLKIINTNVQMPEQNRETHFFGSIQFDLTREQAQNVVNLLEAMGVKVAIAIDPEPMKD